MQSSVQLRGRGWAQGTLGMGKEGSCEAPMLGQSRGRGWVRTAGGSALEAECKEVAVAGALGRGVYVPRSGEDGGGCG